MNNMEAAEILRSTTLFGEQQKIAKAIAIAVLEQQEHMMGVIEHLGRQIPEWTTPENAVPSTTNDVLVQAVIDDTHDRALYIGRWNEDGWELTANGNVDGFRVEAWMPLPAIYEKREKNE